MPLMNKIKNYYKNDGTITPELNQCDYVQIELLGGHATENTACALISIQSLSLILEFAWYLGKDGYPTTYQSIDGKIKLGRGMKMHKMIISKSAISEGQVIDHINRDRLDNRLTNLRICSQKENSYNKSKPSNSKNKYKGVKKVNNSSFTASINKDGKTFEIKDIKDEKEAAKIYDAMAEELFGQFAGKNFN